MYGVVLCLHFMGSMVNSIRWQDGCNLAWLVGRSGMLPSLGGIRTKQTMFFTCLHLWVTGRLCSIFYRHLR